MNNKLYYLAYKFLKLRNTNINPFNAIENLNYLDRNKVINFLRYNHCVKFL